MWNVNIMRQPRTHTCLWSATLLNLFPCHFWKLMSLKCRYLYKLGWELLGGAGKRERPCYFKLVLQIVWGFNKILRKGLLPVVIYLYVKDRAICMLGFHGLFFFLCNAEDSSYESSPLNEWYVIRSFITRALTSVSLSYKILAQCKFFFCYGTEWFLCQH